ncbi:MAG: hypothetical protein IT463_11080 [Planctomycetes bacterium]|nr:hypothetical protein [Planctomycetota bacterium]
MRHIALIGVCTAGLLAGCQDNSAEVQKLRGDVVAQQKRFDDAEDRWSTEKSDLQRQINDLRAQLGPLPVAADGSPTAPLAETLKALNERVEKVESTPAPDARLAELEKRLDTVKADAVEAARLEAAKGGTPGGPAMGEAKVAELMAKKLAEEQAANAPTKALSEALERLGISDAEKDAVKQSILECKKEQLALLETPTAEGRVFADELIDAFIKTQAGEATQADIAKLFFEISKTPVAGDAQGRTYLQAIEQSKAKNKENISRVLTKEDQERLTRAHGDWSEFELGDEDPFTALYMERLDKYNADKNK